MKLIEDHPDDLSIFQIIVLIASIPFLIAINIFGGGLKR